MLTKRTSKNQVTIPKAILQTVGEADYFEVSTLDGRIVLTPVRSQQAESVRDKLQALGLSEQDVADAVSWARTGA